MLTIMGRDCGNSVGVRIAGKLAQADYQRLAQKLEDCLKKHDRVHVLLETQDCQGWEPGTPWEDLRFSFQRNGDFERCAIVGDRKCQDWLTKLSRPFANVRFFEPAEVQEARCWAGRGVVEEEIRELAYRKWEAAGKPPGDGVSFWLEAEQEILQQN